MKLNLKKDIKLPFYFLMNESDTGTVKSAGNE